MCLTAAIYADGHSRYWNTLANPGNWFTGHQRVEMAREVRSATVKFAMRGSSLVTRDGRGSHSTCTSLPESVIEIVHRVATDPNRLTRKWFDDLIASGLTPEAYIEVLGVTIHVFMIDEFCRAIGHFTSCQPVHGHPARPADTVDIGAWVEVLPVSNRCIVA